MTEFRQAIANNFARVRDLQNFTLQGVLVSKGHWRVENNVLFFMNYEIIRIYWYKNHQKSEFSESRNCISEEVVCNPTLGEKSRTSWYMNGQKDQVEFYVNGAIEGLFVGWHENGNKRFETLYSGGERNGPSTHWYSNGQKDSEGTFENGELTGWWNYWLEDGTQEPSLFFTP
jgi:antitoxin component YwqK of YwqJK toxin-antitoxin module